MNLNRSQFESSHCLHAYNFAPFFPSYLALPPAAEATEMLAKTSKMLGGQAGIPYGIQYMIISWQMEGKTQQFSTPLATLHCRIDKIYRKNTFLEHTSRTGKYPWVLSMELREGAPEICGCGGYFLRDKPKIKTYHITG